ncbi:hypothetical protein ABZT07_20665 [Streptomyces sp. NPDC005317]|uniref:hypothetical protein n=1 Tax=Streptomyces sp. NPDC005317 TaxID=3156876 RepID=UPI0033BF8958
MLIKRKVRKRSEVNRQMGRSARIDAGPAREHLVMLHQTMSWSTLVTATGIDDRRLCRIYGGHQTRIARTTHARITAVQPPSQAVDSKYIDATGAIRRISVGRKRHGTTDLERVAELTRQGRTAGEIALDLGVHERTVVRARGRVRANAFTEQAAA